MSQELVQRHFDELLRPYFTDSYRVIYDPAFPRKEGSTFSWFQVIFAVGPADDATAREQVHERFQQLLGILAPHSEIQQADVVALRARRHAPPRTAPDNPHMFIECAWHGSAVAELMRQQNFSVWPSRCYSYINRCDSNDPLNAEGRNA